MLGIPAAAITALVALVMGRERRFAVTALVLTAIETAGLAAMVVTV